MTSGALVYSEALGCKFIVPWKGPHRRTAEREIGYVTETQEAEG